MSNKSVAILDFGSSKITVLIAERGINNTFKIMGKGYADYAGFADGEFFEPDQLKYAVGLAINNAETHLQTKIKKLYVGLPTEFCYSEIKSSSQAYLKKKRITDSDIYDLFDLANDFNVQNTHSVVNRSPISFTTDDGRVLVNPLGEITSSLSAKVSFILAENKLIDMIRGFASEMEIEQVEFMSSALAEVLYVLDKETRSKEVVLVDTGYITTSVINVKGDGVLMLKSLSLGGGHITGDISECLKISFAEAESLKRKIVLSLDVSDEDCYEINIDGKVTPFSARMVNEIVASRIEMIATNINRCLNSSEISYSANSKIYLTGGGIAYLKGGKDYFSKAIGREVEIIAPPVPELNRPHYSSTIGILNMALMQEENLNKNIFKKFLNLFKR